ncbi:MAG: hypothetical protein ACFFBD_17290 [Candidatus Hodarchaeota archaeon]
MAHDCPHDWCTVFLQDEENHLDIGGRITTVQALICPDCDYFIVKKVSRSPRRTLSAIMFLIKDENKAEEVYETLKKGKRVYYDNKTIILVKKEGMTYAGW